MEKYVVSARKYRPDQFHKVVGQSNITSTLKNAIRNNHLAQAFLFSGPRGVGKTTVARLLAKALNCKELTDNTEPCNQCEPCESFNRSSSFNVHELDAASNNSVEDIRSLVDQVRVPPQAGDYKVYIIDEVHMLSTSAFNAFLKTLEEPPSYAKFILATTEKHKIIPTILSRCQSYDFQRIPVNLIREHLEDVAKSEGVIAEPEALQMIAQKADGALRDALSIFDQVVNFAGKEITYEHVTENLNVLDYDYYFRLTHHFLQGNIHDALLVYEEISVKGFAGQQFLTGLGEHLRNMLVCRDEKTICLLETGATIRKKYLELAQQLPTEKLLEMIEITNKADLAYRGANNKRLQVELAVMQLCTAAHAEKKTPNQQHPTEEPTLKPADGNVPAQKHKPISTEKKSSTPETAADTTPAQPSTQNTSTPEKHHDQQEEKNTPVKGRLKGLSSGFSTVSLTEDAPETEKTDQPQPDENNSNEQHPIKKLKIEELTEGLESYINEKKSIKPTFVADLEQCKPGITGDTTVEITLSNKLFAQGEHVLELQRYLRQATGNQALRIKTHTASNPLENKAFTSLDKLNKMNELNPDFQGFRKALDLEYE